MHWTPLSGAKFEDVFGPSGKSPRRDPRPRRGGKARPQVETLEVRLTPAITAGIVASSLASTPDPDATIGEIVRMRVTVQQDLGGTYDPTGFNVEAILPPGLQLLPGNTTMALVSDQGMVSTLDPNNTGGLNVTGNESNVNSVTPTFLVPPSAITTDPTTGAVFFNTGISNVNDSDPNSEFVVIEFNALVTNVATNQAEGPTTLTSQFQLFVGNQPCGECVGGQAVTVVEPTITDLAKTAQLSQDGSSATYTLTFSNTGDSTAYDVRVVDNVPAGLTLDPASVQVVGGTGVTNRSTASTLDLTLDSVAVGGQVTITYTTAIDPSARNGQTITNTVNLDYTSLPGPTGESPNPTGDVTPGASGSPTGERNGSGGVNDYFDSAQANISVPANQPNSISGFVFGDADHSGDFSPGDVLFSGITVSLQDANGNPVTDLSGNVVGPQTTNANGAFSFTNLPDGTYQLVESDANLPAGWMDGNDFPGLINGVQDTTAGSDAIPGDRIFNIQLAGGAVGTQFRFGECPCPPTPAPSSISGFVYLDANRNGVFDAGDSGIPGALVELTDLNGNPVRDLNGNLVDPLTDANGFYQFTNLAAGSYRVIEPGQPIFQGKATTDAATNVGTVNGVPRGTASEDEITNITLAAGENSINNDFGEVLPAVGAISLSGNVYFDSNKDCILDAGDRPVPGVRLHLFLTSGPGGPTEVAQTTTNDRGQYLFEVDTAGTYMVTEDNVAGLIKECAQPGTVNGRPVGTAPAVDDLANITLVNGDAGINYNFALISNTPPPPPFSKQQLLANLPNGSGLGVAGATAFATTPSFANIGGVGDDNIMAVGADAGGAPTVRVFDFTTGQTLFTINAYTAAFRGGVRVAVGDVNGDGTPDVITAPGAGGGPHIKVFDGKTGALIRSFFAYAPTFSNGVYVAAADVNGDGVADVITGAGAGGGPHVKVFDGKTGAVLQSFFAYAPTFAGGVRVAAADFTGDGKADVVTGAGPGGAPHVKVFNLAGAAPVAVQSFFAFAPNFTGGVYVAANAVGQGDVNGDGRADLVVGTGSGAGQVKVIDGASFATISTFTAFDSSLTTRGVRVGVFDLNGDGRGDVVTSTGGGGPLGAFVRVVDLNNTGGDLDFFQAFNPSSLGGAFVAAG